MDLFKYRVWCNVESGYFEVWGEEEPSVCPNNSDHSIDTDRTVIIDKKLDEPLTTGDGKIRVHETSRPIGVKTHFAGSGDDPNNIFDVGGGTPFEIHHQIGDETSQTVYFDMNLANNETWVHEGYVIWKDCELDKVDVEVVTRYCTYHEDSTAGTNFMILPGTTLIVPSLTLGVPFGQGNIVIDNDILEPTGGLVYMPDSDSGEAPTAFWNADFNTSTGKYENLVPAPAGNGRYNIFIAETPLIRFVNKLSLLGAGFEKTQTADSDQLGQGMRFRLTAFTMLPDHEWKACFLFTLYREKTI